MYKSTSVSTLSELQKSKLRNGHPVRIKSGTGNKLHLSDIQIKKLHKAGLSGKGITVQLDPHQTQQHGCGIFGDIATKAKSFIKSHKLQGVVNPAIKYGKAKAHAAVAHVAKLAHNKIDTVQPIGEGLKKKRRGRPRKIGAGFVGDLAGLISQGADALGVGLKKRGRKPGPKKAGKGILTNIAKSVAKAAAPMVVDAASSFVKNKIAGAGKRKPGRPKTVKAKAPKKSPKKTTKPKKTVKRGKSLRPAGY
jgi:hypothetical protein